MCLHGDNAFVSMSARLLSIVKLDITGEYLISSVVMMYVDVLCSQVAYIIVG